MKQLVRNVKIIGTGSYVPEKVYTNEYFETIVDTNAKWIEENIGIKERRIADKNQCTNDLASQTVLRAIEKQASKMFNIIMNTYNNYARNKENN